MTMMMKMMHTLMTITMMRSTARTATYVMATDLHPLELAAGIPSASSVTSFSSECTLLVVAKLLQRTQHLKNMMLNRKS